MAGAGCGPHGSKISQQSRRSPVHRRIPCAPLAPDLGIAPADARDAGRRAVDGARLVYEPKYDGIRGLVELLPARNGTAIRIWSRLGNEKTTQFPSIVRALEKAAAQLRLPLTLDGEIVALDEQGQSRGVPAPSGADPSQGARRRRARRSCTAGGTHPLRSAARRRRGRARPAARRAAETPGGALRQAGVRNNPLEPTSRRRRPRAPGAREGRRVGGPDRKGVAVDLPVRQAQPRVAKTQDSARTGVRGRRMDRTAADAPALRRPALGRVQR